MTANHERMELNDHEPEDEKIDISYGGLVRTLVRSVRLVSKKYQSLHKTIQNPKLVAKSAEKVSDFFELTGQMKDATTKVYDDNHAVESKYDKNYLINRFRSIGNSFSVVTHMIPGFIKNSLSS